MGNQQVGGVLTNEVPGSVASLQPPESHPHASAYHRFRRLSLGGSTIDDQSNESYSQSPSINIIDAQANLHNAHLPHTPDIQGQASSINQLLGLSTQTNRRRGSVDFRDVSPSKGRLNNLLNKGDREKIRFLSGGSGRSGKRRGSVDLAATFQSTFSKVSPDLNTHIEESGSDRSMRKTAQNTPSSSKSRVSKAKDLLFPAISGAGRRMRRGSAFEGISIKPIDKDKDDSPRIPEDLIYEPPSIAPLRSRARALTISNGHAAKASMALAIQRKQDVDRSLVPTVFRYSETAEDDKRPKTKLKEEKKKRKDSESKEEITKVYIAGTMTNWESRQMVQQIGETDYCAILECPEGEVYYRFGICKGDERKPKVEWIVDNNQEVVCNNDFRNPVLANIIRVQKTDREVFAALTVDSFCVKKEGGEEEESDREKREDLWTQQKPQYDGKDKALKTDKGPPILPPHLLQVPLNKEETDPRKYASRADRMMLPEPKSHVMLNHLYAQSIRDNLLVLASTARYKKKCVTIVYYKELPQES